MIGDLKPYPAMKDSDVKWLGEVPEHWESRKLRTVLSNVTARNRPDLPLLSVVREKGVIVRDVSNQDENHNFIPDDLTNYKVVREGQFAMNKMKAWQGSYGVSRHNGIVSPAYFVFDLEGVAGDFFNAAIRSKAYVPFFTQASDGVRIGQWDLSQPRMREISFTLPPLPEQAAIVRYLDHVDRRVRRLVRAKRKLIALLTEQKQAIIHRAVTCGLDPNVRFKPCEIVGIESLPHSWEVTRVGSLSQATKLTGFEYTKHWRPERDGEIIALRGFNIKDRSLDLKNIERISSDLSSTLSRSKLKQGDIVMPCTGTLGHAALIRDSDRYHINQNIAKITPLNRVDPEFLVWVLTSPAMKFQIDLHNTSGLQPVLLIGTIRKLFVQLPPRVDQKKIVSYLNDIDSRFTVATMLYARQIEAMWELRARLVADVVTGKLDVREVAAALPEVDSLDTEEDLEDALDPETDEDLDAIPEEAEA